MANTTTTPATEREHYLVSFEREYQITLKTLKAYPVHQAHMKLNDKTRTAMDVAWTLVMSQHVTEPIQMAPKLEPVPFPPAPADWNALVAGFEQAHAAATKRLSSMTDAAFASTIVIPVGPGGATAPVRRADALWMMLFDTVHHRGQLSVYLRGAGAKVPSIYGPTADEPWF